MKMKRASLFLGALVVITSALTACSGKEQQREESIPELSVAEVASMLDSGEAIAIDANNAETRRQHGVVPGARLLSSSSSYDASAELPSDKSQTLVFYCANTRCRASDGAAARAREAGYAHVNVMRAGIAGWVEAGEPVDHPAS
jgi:rhodanese-related sulfurtransferase